MRRNNPKPVPFLNPAEPGSSIRPGESAAYMHRPPCGQQGFCTFLSTAVKAANSGVYRRLSHEVMRPHDSRGRLGRPPVQLLWIYSLSIFASRSMPSIRRFTRSPIETMPISRRSEERRVGPEYVSTGIFRGSPYHSKKKNKKA